MKYLIKCLLLLLFIFLFSCEDQGLIVKCPDCTLDEPLKTNLEIKLEQAYMGIPTQVNVYEGNLEDSILYRTETISATYLTVMVTLNKKYTVTASYYIPDNFYTAVDEATPRVRFEKNQCDDPCYFIYDKEIDLRLKYTK
jgi:hypothetical protein